MEQDLYRKLFAAAIAIAISGVAIVSARAQFAHEHSPQHGGMFLPAANDTLHLEAVWPMQRIVRVFVYGEDMRPVAPDRLLSIHGSINVAGQAFPLRPTTDGFLEARVPTLPLPASMTLDIALGQGLGDERFAITFSGYSVESRPYDFLLPPTPIPGTLAALLTALHDDQRDAQASVDSNGLIFAYAPAVRARDHLLALDGYVPSLAPAARPRAEAAIRAGVRAAWLLHVAADDGISPWAVRGSVGVLSEALADVVAAFGGASR
jgi:hypothetical protein